MIFIFSLVIAALLCIASFICYKVSGKMLDEKDAEKYAKEAELEEKLINRMMQTKSKPLSDDELVSAGRMRLWSWRENIRHRWKIRKMKLKH